MGPTPHIPPPDPPLPAEPMGKEVTGAWKGGADSPLNPLSLSVNCPKSVKHM